MIPLLAVHHRNSKIIFLLNFVSSNAFDPNRFEKFTKALCIFSKLAFPNSPKIFKPTFSYLCLRSLFFGQQISGRCWQLHYKHIKQK